MISAILWYHKDSALLVEFLGQYSMAQYVQVCHKVRDDYLEFQNHAIDLIVDFRAVDMSNEEIIPLEPLENLLMHEMTRRFCLLPDMRLANIVIQLVQMDNDAPVYVFPHLQAVDELVLA